MEKKAYYEKRKSLEESFIFKWFYKESKKKKKILDLAKEQYGQLKGKYYRVPLGKLCLAYIEDIILWKDKDSGKYFPSLKVNVLVKMEDNGFTSFTQLIKEDNNFEINLPNKYEEVSVEVGREIISQYIDKVIKFFGLLYERVPS